MRDQLFRTDAAQRKTSSEWELGFRAPGNLHMRRQDDRLRFHVVFHVRLCHSVYVRFNYDG